VAIRDGLQETANRVNMTIGNRTNEPRDQVSGPRQTDRANVAIGTNYRSGSAIVATTQEADKMRTVPWWPSVTTTSTMNWTMTEPTVLSKPSVRRMKQRRVDRVNVTIDRIRTKITGVPLAPEEEEEEDDALPE
jgi:hypothetical protein